MFLTNDIYWNVSTGYSLDNKGNVTQSLLSAHTVQSGEKGGKKTIPVSAQKEKKCTEFLRMWSGNKSHDIAGIRMSRMEASVWHDFGSVL